MYSSRNAWPIAWIKCVTIFRKVKMRHVYSLGHAYIYWELVKTVNREFLSCLYPTKFYGLICSVRKSSSMKIRIPPPLYSLLSCNVGMLTLFPLHKHWYSPLQGPALLSHKTFIKISLFNIHNSTIVHICTAVGDFIIWVTSPPSTL